MALVTPIVILAQIPNADPSNLVGATTSDFNSLFGSQYDISKINSFGSVTNVENLKYGDMQTKGEKFLFEDWDNNAMLFVGEKVYRLSNINYDIKVGHFITQMENDSLFIFNKYSVDSISVNNKMFKKFYDPASKDKIVFAEVIYDANGVRILKNHYIKEVEGSPNPMINRPTNQIKKRSKYYTAIDDTLEPFNLNKRNVLKQIEDPSLTEQAVMFAKENRLSFSSEEDVEQILISIYN